jgi:signal transduction histidine kinase
MKALMPAQPREVDPVRASRSASAAIYTLLTAASANPLGLEDWLKEVTQALKARLAALAAIVNDEPVVESFFSGEAGRQAVVSWPWQQDRQFPHEYAQHGPAVASHSADRRSSFLTLAIPREEIRWLLCLEDRYDRTWSREDQAALTLAGLGLFQLAPVQPGAQRWLEWSQRIQSQQRLEDAAAVVGQLAHDFNNVLTSILGFTELSLTQLASGSPLYNLVAEVYAAAQQGSQLIGRLSFFSTRKTVPPGLTTSLHRVLEEVAERWRQTAGDAVALKILVPPDLPALAIDGDSLRAILDKLFANACEAMDSRGTVLLSARPVELTRQDCLTLFGQAGPGSYVQISVADTGRGFSPAARQRVLAEPFFSTKPRYRGLGLASVYGILMNHGGGIRLEHGLERGSVVHVLLPCRQWAANAVSDGDRKLSVDPCLAT